MEPLVATIAVPAGQPSAEAFLITLRITNQASGTVAILNPDMGVPAPEMGWPWSNATYQTSLLLSFHHLSISVTDEAGREIPRDAIETWSVPVLLPKLELASGASLELTIPIGKFYRLVSGRAYWVALEYGDQSLKVSARGLVTVP